MQMRSTLSGSGMITKSVRPFAIRPRARQVRDAGEAAALFVHRAADLDRARAAARRRARSLRRRTPPPRCRPSCRTRRGRRSCPSRTTPPNGSTRPAVAGRHDIEVAVEVNDRPGAAASRADDVDARDIAAVCSARPSAAMYSTSKPRRFRTSPMKWAHASYSSPGGLTVGMRTRSTV